MKDKLNLSSIPRELQFIMDLLKENNNVIQSYSSDFYKEVDWNLFVQQVKHHRVFPLLYSKINQLELPKFIHKFLTKQFKKNTFQMLFLSSEMDIINKTFFEHNIPTLFLKGPALAHSLYGDISLRTSSDLDLLIPLHLLEKAENILFKLGYIKNDYIKTILNDWKWRHHHFTYYHPEKRVKVELHWRLNPGPGKEPKFYELWERRTVCILTDHPICLLGREDLFVFLVSHGARHGWSRLRWLIDIQQLVKQTLDWKRVNQLLIKFSNVHIGGQAIFLAKCLLNIRTTNDMEAIISKRSKYLAQKTIFYFENMINLHNYPLPQRISDYHKQYLMSLMSVKRKTWLFLSYFYPYPEDKELLPLPIKLHFLYFPLRPFLWAWRKAKGQAIS
jgi:hypothetical protein